MPAMLHLFASAKLPLQAACQALDTLKGMQLDGVLSGDLPGEVSEHEHILQMSSFDAKRRRPKKFGDKHVFIWAWVETQLQFGTIMQLLARLTPTRSRFQPPISQ
eukprot:scaffold7452_cov13-Tisochrysis_lutea.AAC.2